MFMPNERIKKVLGSRGVGKTTTLLNYAADNNFTVLTRDPDSLKDKASYLGIKISLIDELSGENIYKYILEEKDFVIDDLDCALDLLTKGHIRGYSLSVDD